VTINYGGTAPGEDMFRIDSSATLVIKDGAIINNRTRACVRVDGGARVIMTGGTLEGLGSGSASVGVRLNGGIFIMYGGAITGCTNAGVHYNAASTPAAAVCFTMYGGSIGSNTLGVRIDNLNNARIDIKATGGVINGTAAGTNNANGDGNPNGNASIQARLTVPPAPVANNNRVLAVGANEAFQGHNNNGEWVGTAIP
jgi:hypothetical protein